jgi:SAM domain (Sterile alpha motif)
LRGEMLDVARWLAEQRLGHHAEAFAENGIAGDVSMPNELSSKAPK